MLSDGDRAQMRADLLKVRADREESIVIRRGTQTLAAQLVRVARMGQGSAQRRDSAGAEQAVQRVIVAGGVDLNIQPQDRFNDGNGTLFEVVMVRPNRSAVVVAEAEAIQ